MVFFAEIGPRYDCHLQRIGECCEFPRVLRQFLWNSLAATTGPSHIADFVPVFVGMTSSKERESDRQRSVAPALVRFQKESRDVYEKHLSICA